MLKELAERGLRGRAAVMCNSLSEWEKLLHKEYVQQIVGSWSEQEEMYLVIKIMCYNKHFSCLSTWSRVSS